MIKKKNQYKTRQILGSEIPGTRKFPRCHQVLSRRQIIESSVVFISLRRSHLVEGFIFDK